MIYQVDNAELAREFEPDLTLERAIGFLNYYFFTLTARFGLTGRFGLSFGLFLIFQLRALIILNVYTIIQEFLYFIYFKFPPD